MRWLGPVVSIAGVGLASLALLLMTARKRTRVAKRNNIIIAARGSGNSVRPESRRRRRLFRRKSPAPNPTTSAAACRNREVCLEITIHPFWYCSAVVYKKIKLKVRVLFFRNKSILPSCRFSPTSKCKLCNRLPFAGQNVCPTVVSCLYSKCQPGTSRTSRQQL